MKKILFVFVVLFFFCIPSLRAGAPTIKERILVLVKQDMESRKDVLVLEPFTIKATKEDKVYFIIEEKEPLFIEVESSNDRLFGKELPFYFVEEATPPIQYSDFSLSIDGIKKARGGIILSKNATLYLKVGILWKSYGKYKFYCPYVYRSILGIGFRRIL